MTGRRNPPQQPVFTEEPEPLPEPQDHERQPLLGVLLRSRVLFLLLGLAVGGGGAWAMRPAEMKLPEVLPPVQVDTPEPVAPIQVKPKQRATYIAPPAPRVIERVVERVIEKCQEPKPVHARAAERPRPRPRPDPDRVFETRYVSLPPPRRCSLPDFLCN